MVEKLQQVLNKFRQDAKPVWLFAVLKMDEITDRWSLIISAPWLNNGDSFNREYEYVIRVLKEFLTDEELFSLARVSAVSKTDHLVEELLKKQTGTSITEEKINGNIVHEGSIIESKPNLT
jgi:hypothetical protein